MQIVKVRFRTNSEFDEHYQAGLEGGGLFCPTTSPFEEGEPLIIELSVPALPNKVLIRGVVRSWRPALPRLRVRAGAVVEFSDDEAEKRDFILETIAGDREPPSKRKHTRLPMEVPVRYRTSDQADFSDCLLSEISVGGAMLLTDEPLPLETDVILEMTPTRGRHLAGDLRKSDLPPPLWRQRSEVSLPRRRRLAASPRARPPFARRMRKRRRGAVFAKTPLFRVLDRYGIERELKEHRLLSHWKTVVGDRVASRTFPDGLSKGVLWVRVANSAWLHELSFMRDAILAKSQRDNRRRRRHHGDSLSSRRPPRLGRRSAGAD